MPGFNASQDYLFADHLHPGPQVHTIIAQYIQSIIAAPVQATYLNQSIQSMAQGSRTTLDSRYQQLRQGKILSVRWACSAATAGISTA